jgi:hypothetical protein
MTDSTRISHPVLGLRHASRRVDIGDRRRSAAGAARALMQAEAATKLSALSHSRTGLVGAGWPTASGRRAGTSDGREVRGIAVLVVPVQRVLYRMVAFTN